MVLTSEFQYDPGSLYGLKFIIAEISDFMNLILAQLFKVRLCFLQPDFFTDSI